MMGAQNAKAAQELNLPAVNNRGSFSMGNPPANVDSGTTARQAGQRISRRTPET